MEKKSTPKLSSLPQLAHAFNDGLIPEKYQRIMVGFIESYMAALESLHIPLAPYIPIFETFVRLVREQFLHPYQFQPYHAQIRTPFDYYTYGLDFVRPLVDWSKSSVKGLEYGNEIKEHLQKGANVILLANHQSEADPQLISVLLEKTHPELGAQMIFVAGERVVTDPLAVPFSMGRNLLCIYSKRYIDHPPEQKMKKQLHNKKTMELMSDLLSQGGKCIYVAPSGGRDRPNQEGVFEVASFDPQSIEMFYLMAKKAKRPTYFYPLALLTYPILPPPQMVQIELGECRKTQSGAIHLAFGPQINMEEFPGKDLQDKHERRKMRAEFIWQQVVNDYTQISNHQ